VEHDGCFARFEDRPLPLERRVSQDTCQFVDQLGQVLKHRRLAEPLGVPRFEPR